MRTPGKSGHVTSFRAKRMRGNEFQSQKGRHSITTFIHNYLENYVRLSKMYLLQFFFPTFSYLFYIIVRSVFLPLGSLSSCCSLQISLLTYSLQIKFFPLDFQFLESQTLFQPVLNATFSRKPYLRSSNSLPPTS